MSEEIADKIASVMTEKQMNKLRKILEGIHFFAIATSDNDMPQATMVQPILYDNWTLVFMSDQRTKKVRNLKKNPNTWMIADATGLFKIPKVVYIRGTAKVEQLTEKRFEELLKHHGPLSTRVFRSLAKDGIDDSVIVTVTPDKFITVGVFGGMNEQVSFDMTGADVP